MATATLPGLLQTKLDNLAARLRRLRLLRGVSWAVFALVGGAAAVMALDYWLELPALARIVLFVAWLGATGLAVWRGLVRPLRRPLTAAALAAVVEEEYPRLRERLSSSVELSETADAHHGSRLFVTMLVRETDLKTRALDFQRAAPGHAAEWSAAGAVVALLLLAAPAVFWPDSALGLGRRLLAPWDGRPAYLPFTIAVTPGDAFAAKGRPLTLAVELAAKQEGVELPATCTLVLTPADGKALRLRMAPGQKPHSFAFRIDDVKGDYRYRVEVGTGLSDTHTIIAVEPVELAAGHPVVTLTPPAYAPSVAPEKVEGLSDLTVLQFGRVTFDCQFTRSAESATLIWTPATDGAQPTRIPLQLRPDRLSASVELPARESGALRLELDAGRGILTTPAAQTLTVTADRPPEFRRVTGLPEQADARLTDTLPLTLTVGDDLGVVGVEIEYRVGDGPIQREPVPLTGLGTPLASGPYSFALAGKVKDGDVVRVRFRAADTRHVPEADLGPNVAYFPPGDRWAELRVVREADSLRQQEVTAKRDEFEKRLQEIIDQLGQNQRQLYRLHQEQNRRQGDPEEHAETLRQVREANDGLTKKLNDLHRDAATAGFAPLAEKAQDVADDEVRQAGEALRDAGTQAGQSRVAPLRRAEAATIQAREKLEALVKENRDLAKAQLDEAALRDLAERERALAEKVNQATTPAEREKLAAQQKELADQLQKLGQNNEAVREAVRAAQAEQARRLAAQAAELAKTERALDERLREAERQQNAERLAGLAEKQQQLADDAARLAQKTQEATEAARVPPLKADDAAKAADALRRGEADDAVKQQERTARDLDKLAENLQRSLELNRDPKKAAEQLMKLQDETRQRLRTNPLDRETLQREEQALRRAIERLPLPPDNIAAQREQRDAADQAAQAAQKLEQNNPKAAFDRMTDAREALHRLSLSLPNAEQRLQKARDEVAKLRKQQDEVGRQVEQAARLGERTDPLVRQRAADERAEAERKQAELAEKLAKLDTPAQEARRDQAQRAAAQALDDLMDRRNGDVPASQGDARRALERLQDALAGQTASDDKARALAQQQRQLADDAAKAGGDPGQRADLQRRQEQIAREAQKVNATEAPVRQAEAVQSAIQANKALREQPNDPATADKVKDAAEKLQQWADQLAGGESNAQRAERVARDQEAAARKPQPNPTESGQKTNQITEEARQVRGGEQASAEKQQALDALSRLQRTPPQTNGHTEAQQAAADALRKLADKLGEPKAEPAANAAQPPPTARELAQQQRDLAGQTEAARRQSGADQRQSLERAAQRQQQLQEQAGRLPAEQAPQAVQQARQAMDRANQALAKNDAAQAAQQQRNAAQALEQAARQADRAANDARRAEQQADDGQTNAEQVGQARELAQQQRELREQVQQTLGQSGDGRAVGEATARAQQQQQEVARQSGELAKGLEKTAGQMPNDKARAASREAAQAAQKAGESLQQAQSDNPSQSQPARRQAIDALDRAAQQAEQAAQAANPGQRRASPNGQPGPADAGQALQQAQGQMNQAREQLSEGQNRDARGSMQQAAQALDKAAQQVGQGNTGDGQRDADQRTDSATRPATGATPGRGDPTAADLPPDLQKYVGKKWGELPGELRTRILQDVKSQYGDDYARIIKLYFEQIADSNPRK